MYQSYDLLPNYRSLVEHERTEDVARVSFQKPIRIATYAIQKGKQNRKELIENYDDCYVRYSLDQSKKQKTLDLKVKFESMLDEEFVHDILRWSGKLDTLLEIILKNRYFFQSRSDQHSQKLTRLNCDFVTYRGTFTYLLACQYDHATSFLIYAELFRGTIYLQLEKLQDELAGLDGQLSHTLGGYRFEQYCTEAFSAEEKGSGLPQSKVKGVEKSVSEEMDEFKEHATKELHFIFRNKVNNHSVIYSAEVDCFEKYTDLHENPLDSDRYGGVELKTSKKITSGTKQEQMFRRYKTLRWWAQSVLVNMKKISVGYRNERGLVDEIQEYSLRDLATIGDWSPKICFYQLDRILTFIKQSFASNPDTKLLAFSFEKYSKRVLCIPSKLVVVPESYKREFA